MSFNLDYNGDGKVSPSEDHLTYKRVLDSAENSSVSTSTLSKGLGIALKALGIFIIIVIVANALTNM